MGPAADSGGLGYRLVRAFSRALLNLFYARIEVVGAENIPATGALVVAANHHNSVVDAMLLIAVVPRLLRALANAPLFRHPLIGPFLRAIGALPVQRRQEAGDDPTRNIPLFAATTATLRGGGAILIFPEGRTQPEPVLQALRTGTARMILAAESAPVTLLPVGLVYEKPGTFRAGRALVLIGAPIVTADCLGDATSEGAARILTERLADAIRTRIVEADDRHTLRLLGLVEELWRENNGAPALDHAARVAWLRRAMRTYRLLLQRAPERVAAFRKQIEVFDTELDQAGLAAVHLSREYSSAAVARFTFREGLQLLVGAPLALCGMIAHMIPYQITAAAVRLIPHTDEEEATDKIAGGVVFYPLAWAAEAYAAFAIGGRWALIGFLAALLPVGFFALAWRERLERVGLEARTFVRVLRDRDLLPRLRRRRHELAAELESLSGIAPEAWSD